MSRRAWILTKTTFQRFNADQCTQHAAAISYYALFSIVPLAIFFFSIIGFVLTDDERRADVVDRIVDALPLSNTDGRDAVEDTIDSISTARGPIAAIGLATTLWTASAMFGAIRRSLDIIWRVEEHRPYFRGKLIDLAQVGFVAAFLLASIIATGVLRWAREVSSDHLGWLAERHVLWEIPAIALPALLTLVTFTLLYRFVPAKNPDWRDVLPGALIATLLFEVLKNLFAIYVANFNHYNVVYGSLGGVVLFLLNVWLASNILLIGAEIAHTSQRYHAGELDAQIYPATPGPSIAEQARRAVLGLFVRQ
jgi:membrane protein